MYLRVRDTTLFFDVDGEKWTPHGPAMREKPTLVLLHGGPGFDHASFKPAFSALTDVAQVVYLDHRGNGRSDRTEPERWNLAEWGDDVRAFCEALGIERPIVLGQSFGGMVAMSYATRHPDHPGGLILSSTAARHDIGPVLDAFERLGGDAARAAAAAYWGEPGPATLPDYARICFPLYSRTPQDPNGNHRTEWNFEVMFGWGGGEGLTFDLRPDLAKVACPTLVLVGEDDPITPVPAADEIAAALPPEHTEVERFAGCGHGVFRDDPERGLDAIRRFLAATGPEEAA